MLVRIGAASGLLCGLLIAVPGAIEAFTGETAATSFALGLAPAFAPLLLVALYLGQIDAAGRFGATAFAVNLVGLGLFGGAAFALNQVVFYLDDPVLGAPTRIALLSSALVFVVGTVLFGVATLRARVYPRLPVVLYTVALPLFALLAPLPDTPLTSGLHVVVGTTLIWLALVGRNRVARTRLVT